jgi:hypothetical protein
MDKYEIKNGEWKVKTAQQQPVSQEPEAPEYKDDDGSGWFADNQTAIRSLNVDRARQIFTLVYGDGSSTNGQWIQYLQNSIKAFQYLDADYAANIQALIEDLDELREANLKHLRAMEAEKAPGQFDMGAFDPSAGNKKPSKRANPGAARQSSGRSQRTPSF